MLKVCSLSSGSNGNAFFIKTGDDSFLVDAGISCKQIRLRLEQVGSHIDDIKGIFITHEHSDHIRGLDVLIRRFPVPVYVTEKTYQNLPVAIDEKYLNFIKSSGRFSINGTEIQALPKSHDAVDPALFIFHYKNKKVSVITDAGYGCGNVVEAVRGANVVFLESNYDEEMLRTGFYPPFLKKRIAGRHGHLSNIDAGSLIVEHAGPELEYVFLSHLSENNNTPTLAMQAFKSVIEERADLQGLNTLLTSRHEVSEIVEILASQD
jgi:phosphoribosyl 1,2-cyclic phosphodiesterase